MRASPYDDVDLALRERALQALPHLVDDAVLVRVHRGDVDADARLSRATPKSAASCADSATSAVCSTAFVGMQPQWRQVPPTFARSTSATSRPSCAARSAVE
jgi:hypothetical protein